MWWQKYWDTRPTGLQKEQNLSYSDILYLNYNISYSFSLFEKIFQEKTKSPIVRPYDRQGSADVRHLALAYFSQHKICIVKVMMTQIE